MHFVGIIAFMPQPATPSARTGAQDDGVRVASIQRSASTPVSDTRSTVLAVIPQDFPDPLIAKHTAMIMYRTGDYISSKGWKGAPLHRDGLQYVPLNHGDLVSFDTGGATNPPVDFPKALPHHPARARTSQLDLLPSYSPDDRSHATVVSIPAGTLSVCEDNHRSDTTITMNARGSFVIKVKTESGTKTLKLKSGAEVAIVNVPLSYAETPADHHQNTNHYMEYCVMAGLPTDRSHCPPPSYMPSAPACAWQGRDMLVAQANAGHSMSQTAGADCSNTQWP
ncbi:MAG TPA: hypothetical protein VGJ82_15255 [Thermoanaerobaculia bacterium]